MRVDALAWLAAAVLLLAGGVLGLVVIRLPGQAPGQAPASLAVYDPPGRGPGLHPGWAGLAQLADRRLVRRISS